MASLEIDQPQQHSQLGAMGVAEPKTKKPQQMLRLEWVQRAGAYPACWSGSLGHVPQTLIALPIRERTALIDATTDLAQLPARVIHMNTKPSAMAGPVKAFRCVYSTTRCYKNRPIPCGKAFFTGALRIACC